MRDNTLISIIMPVYNSDKYLSESIESVQNQSYPNWELLIIDDSSTDNSKNISLSYANLDHRIKIIDNKYEKGIHGALNSGLDLCKGEFVARADADDINHTDRIKIQLEYLLKNKDIDIVGSGYELFGSINNKTIHHPSKSALLAWKFISNTYFCHPSVMFRREVLETIHHYPIVPCEDFAFFSKIIHKHRGANIRKILLRYRQHDNNYSNTANQRIEESVRKTFIENYKFYTEEEKHSEIFYNFQNKKNIKLLDIFKIIKINKKISKKIKHDYHLSLAETLNLLIYQNTYLIMVCIYSTLRIFYKFLKRN